MRTAVANFDIHRLLKVLLFLALIGLYLYMSTAFAALGDRAGDTGSAGGDPSTLGEVAQQVTSSFTDIAKFITAASYIGGFGFCLASIFKFKAHKDNPTQIQIGTPIALFFVGIAMLFLPNFMTIGGKTVLGESAKSSGVTGTATLPGMDSSDSP